jgi:hypothetical protein
VALGSIQANSLIALGRIFDRDPRTHNVARLLKLAKSNSTIFSKAALKERKKKDLTNENLNKFMKNLKEPKSSYFKRLELFVEERRKVYEKCYKQIRDMRYAHQNRGDMRGFYARTNQRELARLLTDMGKLKSALRHWYHNGKNPQPSRLRGTAGREVQKETREFLRSLSALYRCLG